MFVVTHAARKSLLLRRSMRRRPLRLLCIRLVCQSPRAIASRDAGGRTTALLRVCHDLLHEAAVHEVLLGLNLGEVGAATSTVELRDVLLAAHGEVPPANRRPTAGLRVQELLAVLWVVELAAAGAELAQPCGSSSAAASRSSAAGLRVQEQLAVLRVMELAAARAELAQPCASGRVAEGAAEHAAARTVVAGAAGRHGRLAR
eukprot:COSAG02_NODE_704_length_18279_cov_100.299560_9_plen_203_part_00